MNLKQLVLPVFLLAGLSAIYFLPTAGKVADSAIKMKLPSFEGGWEFDRTQPSQKELDTLSPDTEFSKAICYAVRPGEYNVKGQAIPDRLDLSIVLSGYDLNNSIHRPERCMPAQGHRILSGSDVPITIGNGRKFTVRRLLSMQNVPTSADRKTSQEMRCVTYYFFVGHDRIERMRLQISEGPSVLKQPHDALSLRWRADRRRSSVRVRILMRASFTPLSWRFMLPLRRKISDSISVISSRRRSSSIILPPLGIP